MASPQAGRSRDQAVAQLKGTLVAQFGPRWKDLVETEVSSKLAERSGPITKEDLDDLEQRIAKAKRERRLARSRKLDQASGGSAEELEKSQRRMIHQRSAPTLHGVPGPAASMSSGAASGPVLAPPRRAPGRTSPVPPVGVPPSARLWGAAASAAVARSASAAALNRPRKAPFAMAPPGMEAFASSIRSTGSSLDFPARFPVPNKPLLKPLDHWDLVVQFDAAKYKAEMESMNNKGKLETQAQYRKGLDAQRQEHLDKQGELDRELLREKEAADENIARARARDAEEAEKNKAKADKIRTESFMAYEQISNQKQRMRELKALENEAMQRWLQSEKDEAREIEQKHLQECAARNLEARHLVQAAEDERANAREADRAADKAMMAAMKDRMEKRDAQRQAEEEAREARLKMIAGGLGAALEKSEAEKEASLEQRIARIVAERERAKDEEDRRRKETHAMKVKECNDVRRRQLEWRQKQAIEERDDDVRQAKVWKKDYEDMVAAEKAKVARARKARQDVDVVLVEKMRQNAAIHPDDFGALPNHRRTEVAMNKVIYEQMMAENFACDKAGALLKEAHDTGKLGHHLSVAAYEGEIHPLELEEPPL